MVKLDVKYSQAPHSEELKEKGMMEKYDHLPAWQRHMIYRMIEHGDMAKAADEAGVSKHVSRNVDQTKVSRLTLADALEKGGVDAEFIITHIMDCLEGETIKLDGKGNPIKLKDLRVKLSAIELLCKIRGDFEGKIKSKDDEELFKTINTSGYDKLPEPKPSP
jgi:hypothetical protein